MGLADAFVQELDQEGATTRRVLERVPTDKLAWKPHPKSMSLGELAQHIAMSPGFLACGAVEDCFDFADGGDAPPVAGSTAEIVANHDKGLAQAKDAARKLGDAGLMREWEVKANGATLMKMPKVAAFRTLVLNHSYHHRGQLSVYLRLLDVSVPSIYGPSADENPFAPKA